MEIDAADRLGYLKTHSIYIFLHTYIFTLSAVWLSSTLLSKMPIHAGSQLPRRNVGASKRRVINSKIIKNKNTIFMLILVSM